VGFGICDVDGDVLRLASEARQQFRT